MGQTEVSLRQRKIMSFIQTVPGPYQNDKRHIYTSSSSNELPEKCRVQIDTWNDIDVNFRVGFGAIC